MKLYFGRFEQGKFIVSEVEAKETEKCYRVEMNRESNYNKIIRKDSMSLETAAAFLSARACADFFLGVAKSTFVIGKTRYEAVETWIRENEK